MIRSLMEEHHSLASYRHCVERAHKAWPHFLSERAKRLERENASERVAEAILEDLFVGVLDWSKGDVAYQLDYADMILSCNGLKYLVIEVKRPGLLMPGKKAMERATSQARRYAGEQSIRRLAVSDGRYLFASDIVSGGLKERVSVDLASQVAPAPALWWLSMHGIYRPCDNPVLLADGTAGLQNRDVAGLPGQHLRDDLLHHKYRLPARCFAYVADVNDPKTWKLPYLCADGRPDTKRLPGAIRSIISNYRGTKVGGIPLQAIPDVLLRLARAANAAGRLPPKASKTAATYVALAQAMEQLGLSL